MKKSYVSDLVIRRLPRYYRYLDEMYNKGITRISSKALAERMHITASQIRQDLSCFGEFGQQGYGYNVLELKNEIARIVGLDQHHRIILVGAGHLGEALIKSFPFSSLGFEIDAAFDIDPQIIGKTVNGIRIYAMEELKNYLQKHPTDIAALTVPRAVAQNTADCLMDCGIRGIWNFTQLEIIPKPGVRIEYIHFMDSLMNLNYHLTHQQDE